METSALLPGMDTTTPTLSGLEPLMRIEELSEYLDVGGVPKVYLHADKVGLWGWWPSTALLVARRMSLGCGAS